MRLYKAVPLYRQGVRLYQDSLTLMYRILPVLYTEYHIVRTEPQVRCYAHGCDNISNVAFISRLRLVNGACDYKPATLVVGH